MLIYFILLYLYKLKHLLHNRIDQTVEMLRTKPLTIKRKRANKDKTISAPPIKTTSWCLSTEALEKFGRSTDNIPNYDPDNEDIEDIEDTEDTEDIEDRNMNHQNDKNDGNAAGNSKKNKRKKDKQKKKEKRTKKTRK
jgi:hypothetical protein